MPNKVYRLKKEHVLNVEDTHPSTLEMAYVKGYAFIQCENMFYILNTNKSHSSLVMQLVSVEFVS
jgi:hypothetical protein